MTGHERTYLVSIFLLALLVLAYGNRVSSETLAALLFTVAGYIIGRDPMGRASNDAADPGNAGARGAADRVGAERSDTT